MEDIIKEIVEKVENHEKRIRELESLIQPKKKETSHSKPEEIVDVIEAFKSLDLSEYSYIYDLSSLSLFLAIMHIAKEELDIDGLTPPETTRICKEKIRISKGVNRTTISNALSRAGASVDRIDNPRGKGFAYRIMKPGEQLLQEDIKKAK